MSRHFLSNMIDGKYNIIVFNWAAAARVLSSWTAIIRDSESNYTIQIFKNVGSAYQIADAQIHTLAIELTAGEIVKCTASVHGREYSKVAKATPSDITQGLEIGGSTIKFLRIKQLTTPSENSSIKSKSF